MLTVMALTLVCAGVLWATQQVTGPRIEAQRAAALRSSLLNLAGAARLQALTADSDWPLKLCDQMTLVQAQSRGYGGTITLALGLVPGASGPVIENLQTVSHQETPGIGDFIAETGETRWLARFRGLTALDLVERTATVDAVSGATVTVNAVRQAVTERLVMLAEQPDLFNAAACPKSAR